MDFSIYDSYVTGWTLSEYLGENGLLPLNGLTKERARKLWMVRTAGVAFGRNTARAVDLVDGSLFVREDGRAWSFDKSELHYVRLRSVQGKRY